MYTVIEPPLAAASWKCPCAMVASRAEFVWYCICTPFCLLWPFQKVRENGRALLLRSLCWLVLLECKDNLKKCCAMLYRTIPVLYKHIAACIIVSLPNFSKRERGSWRWLHQVVPPRKSKKISGEAYWLVSASFFPCLKTAYTYICPFDIVYM